MADDGGYPKAPDLQELVEKHGGYDKITQEAWREHDAAMAEWEIARRVFTCGKYYASRKDAPKPKRTARRMA